MKERLIQLACLAILLIVSALWLSAGSAFHWNAEADGVLSNGLNASGVIESAKPQNTVTVDQYRQSLPPGVRRTKDGYVATDHAPFGECMDPKWTLTDYRDSPMFKPGGIYSGRIGADGNWEFDNRKIVEAPFRRGR